LAEGYGDAGIFNRRFTVRNDSWLANLRLGILALALFGFAIAVRALPNVGQELEYYSDGTYTTQVGYYNYECGGTITKWGHGSTYILVDTPPWSCDSNGCSGGFELNGSCGGLDQLPCYTCNL
jgi:hypothetical protein